MTNEERIAYINEWLKDEYALNPKDREVLTAALKALEELPKRRKSVKRWRTKAVKAIKALEQQKTGHWIDDEFGSKCSCCGIHTHLDKFDRPMKFKCCSMCGAKMVEQQEINCNYTDEEIAKSFIEDVEAVKDQLPWEER